MMTMAAHQPRIDPRIAGREAREAEQARLAALERQRQRSDDYDPAALRTPDSQNSAVTAKPSPSCGIANASLPVSPPP